MKSHLNGKTFFLPVSSSLPFIITGNMIYLERF